MSGAKLPDALRLSGLMKLLNPNGFVGRIRRSRRIRKTTGTLPKSELTGRHNEL